MKEDLQDSKSGRLGTVKRRKSNLTTGLALVSILSVADSVLFTRPYKRSHGVAFSC